MDTELLTRVESINAGVSKMVHQANRNVLPKFDTIIPVSFQYESTGRWYSIECSLREYEQMLITGHLDDKPLAAVEVSITDCGNAEGDKVKMIYDFVKLHTGGCPWRMI